MVVAVWPTLRALALREAVKRLVEVAEVVVELPVIVKLPSIVEEAVERKPLGKVRMPLALIERAEILDVAKVSGDEVAM